MTEQAKEVFDQIKPDEPPPPVKPPEGEGGDPHRHEPSEPFSPAAAAVSLAFMAGGLYLFVVGLRALRGELARLRGGVT